MNTSERHVEAKNLSKCREIPRLLHRESSHCKCELANLELDSSSQTNTSQCQTETKNLAVWPRTEASSETSGPNHPKCELSRMELYQEFGHLLAWNVATKPTQQ